MSDSLINKLNESLTVNPTDFTVFDILNSNDGNFYTKKVSFDTITQNITGNILTSLQSRLNSIQSSLNTSQQELNNKLDKRGLGYDSGNKMTGVLSVNAPLSVFNTGHFLNGIDVHNTKIVNLNDPVNPFDGVNKRYVDNKLSTINIPSTTLYLPKSGGTMTGALGLNSSPVLSSHAANKDYVDKKFDSVKFVKVSGDTMTGNLVLNTPPTLPAHAVNKDYVDKNIVIGNYVYLSGGTMTGSLSAYADPVDPLEVATKRYVDQKLVAGNFLPLSGGTMTGTLAVLTPTSPSHAATKAYVDANKVNTSNFLPISGGTMTGALIVPPPSLNQHVASKLYVDQNKIVAQNFLPINGGVMTGTLTISGYSETVTDVTIDGISNIYVNLDSSINPVSNNINVTLNANCSGFVFLPLTGIDTVTKEYTIFIKQGGNISSGFYNVNWVTSNQFDINGYPINPYNNYNIRWSNGAPPIVTKINGAVDIIKLKKYKLFVLGTVIGQNFS